ncbi:MAG: aminotransferase class I/II-fold pyridoxal phosphate-dependent enzyme [Candidatus Promineifilaceae bacterium]|nr:aminotransferase class I/II-fold pyridoxal phosphate-dependent enzyme [Candidatus Promineifilaceae bacterium]
MQLDISPKQVIIGPGSKSLIYAILAALDSDIIMPTPAWSSYKDLATLNQRPILEVPMDPENDFHPDSGRMAHAIDAAAKQWRQPDTLLLCNPHNPTGTTLSQTEVQAIIHFARERGLLILSDEIYSWVTYDGHEHTTCARDYPERTIILGGLSKQMSVGGWRLGVAVLPSTEAGDALARAVQAIAGCIWSCAPAPVQFAALKAYSREPEIEAYMQACTQSHSIRTHYLYDALDEFGIPCPRPSAAFYLYPSFANWREALAQRNVTSCRELSRYLLEKYDIATLPGSTFGDDPKALALRFSTSFLDMETDEQADNIVRAYREENDPDQFINNHHPRLRAVVSRLADFITELEDN